MPTRCWWRTCFVSLFLDVWFPKKCAPWGGCRLKIAIVYFIVCCWLEIFADMISLKPRAMLLISIVNPYQNLQVHSFPRCFPYKVGPPFGIAKLVNITPMSLWFMVTIVTGANLNPFSLPSWSLAGLEGTTGHWKEDQGGQVGDQAAEGSSEGAVKVAEDMLLDRYIYISFYHSFIHSFIHSFVHSFIHSFVLSIYLFIYLIYLVYLILSYLILFYLILSYLSVYLSVCLYIYNYIYISTYIYMMRMSMNVHEHDQKPLLFSIFRSVTVKVSSM